MAKVETPYTILPQVHQNKVLQYLGLEVLIVEASIVATDIVEESVTGYMLTRSTVQHVGTDIHR